MSRRIAVESGLERKSKCGRGVLTWIEEGRRLRLADDNPKLRDINAEERSGECVFVV